MPTYEQTPIRLELTLASDPPVFPVDVLTGLAPQAWRGSALAIALGIFDKTGEAVDLSDVDFIEVDIFPAVVRYQPPGAVWNYGAYSSSPNPNLPPAPLEFVTVPASGITATITREAWLAGDAAQAVAAFSWVQMQEFDLGGRPAREFWLAVSGLTSAGTRIVYGGSPFVIYEAGSQGIYLPNNLAPIVVPAQTTLYIGPNQQMPFSLPITVLGTIAIDDGSLVQT